MYYFPNKQKTLREDATRCKWNIAAYGSLHLARKAEQVTQGLRDLGSSKRTCPLCSSYFILRQKAGPMKSFEYGHNLQQRSQWKGVTEKHPVHI